MNSSQNPLPSETQQQSRQTWLGIGALVALLFAGSELAALWIGGNLQIWAVLPVFIALLIIYWFTRTGRQLQGSFILIAAIAIQSLLLPLVQRGSSLPDAITALILISGICLATLPRKYFGRILGVSLLVLIASVLMDLFGGLSRPAAALGVVRWGFLFLTLAAFAVFLVREFLALDIRTKIVAGILGTGALALAVFIFFALSQIQQVTGALSDRLNTSVSELAQEQLRNTAFIQADQANQSFKDVISQVSTLAQNWSALHAQKDVISQRTYWDASTNLIQLPGGQYGNVATATSAIFVPSGLQVDEGLVTELNTSSYLDFYVPGVMKENPLLRAVYAVDTNGVIRRYPNNNLASKLSPDNNETEKAYYKITDPRFNPQRLPRWATPYTDPTDGELLVTIAAPVYDGDHFIGVVAADMRLGGIAEQINSIKIGQTGFAYMIDNTSHIISMPQAGYEMFDIRPEEFNTREFYDRTIEDSGTLELKSLTKRMTAGGTGLQTVTVNGDETYISFAPVKSNKYSVALVVPVSQLQGTIVEAQKQTEQQERSATQTAAVILIILFIVAIAVSLGLGQVIAAPVRRLTQVATQIAGGDLSVQATVTTRDEIGTLAQSFNTMTSRLRETLDGLERMVDARTAELLSANERNERRAKEFESIAQVARTLSSTYELDSLLTQTTTLISREFGFYHVGIFLLDAAHEYAILSATNSEGGRAMLQRGHRLKVGETGIVGYVTGTGKPRVALDTGSDAVFFSSVDLPETRSEMALPLRAGEEIIGALDVQSSEPSAFSQEDINILSTLADQVSIAIQNARQFEQTRKALNEAESLAKQFAKAGWQQYTKDKNLLGIHHTGARATLLYEKNGNKEKGAEVWDTDTTQAKSRGAFLSLPIELRGEVIGSVDVRSPDSRPWDQDELDIITAIIERAAIAMENARLLEESQRLASKEAKISAVTAKISSSINMRNVLQTAVEELGHALPGSEVVIQFQTDQSKTTS